MGWSVTCTRATMAAKSSVALSGWCSARVAAASMLLRFSLSETNALANESVIAA